MSTHTKFNPEGVKGKAAQPPHKIFNFMRRQIITITLNVKDINTQIELPNHVWEGETNTALRAVRAAEFSAQSAAHRRWVKWAKSKYGVTAEQLYAMFVDGLLQVPNLVEVKLESIDCLEEAKLKVKPSCWARLTLWHEPNEW